MFQMTEKVGLVSLTAIASAVAGAFFFLIVRQGFPKVVNVDRVVNVERLVKPEFMNAHVSVTCDATELAKYSQLVAVISSEDGRYIREVKKHLDSGELVQEGSVIYTSFINKRAKDEVLLRDTRRPDMWVAYSVDVKPQYPTTTIKVPTIFDMQHTTRMFVMGREPFISRNSAEVDAFANAVAPAREISLVAEVNFLPESPGVAVQEASLEVSFFGNICGKRAEHDAVGTP
jgi:hypothetical protein